MKKISIIGAGGHTRSSINILKKHYADAVFSVYDESFNPQKIELIAGIELKGNLEDIDDKSLIFLSVGDNLKREKLFKKYNNQIITNNLFHTTSYTEEPIKIGISNQILANAYINSYVEIKDNNIINTSVIIEHEVKIGSHNHIAIGAKICGRCEIGSRCMIGANATIIDSVKICDDVVIGAGSVVTKDITNPGTYVGVPAKKIK